MTNPPAAPPQGEMKQYIVPIEINGLSVCLLGLPDGEKLFIVALQFGDRGHKLGTPFINAEFPNGVLESFFSTRQPLNGAQI